MMNKKTKFAAIAAVVAAVVIIVVIFAAKGVHKTDPVREIESEQPSVTDETAVYTPTFMYFVSNGDADFEITNNMLEELKKEYEGRVKFEIINVDDVPEAKENFPVDQQTPALIMLNTKNDISAIEFKCGDKQKLKQYIEAALQ